MQKAQTRECWTRLCDTDAFNLQRLLILSRTHLNVPTSHTHTHTHTHTLSHKRILVSFLHTPHISFTHNLSLSLSLSLFPPPPSLSLSLSLTPTTPPPLSLSGQRRGRPGVSSWPDSVGRATEVSGSWLSLLSYSPWDCRQYYRTHTPALTHTHTHTPHTHTHTHTHTPEERPATTHSI